MKRCIIIRGLPGSGKTTLAQELIQQDSDYVLLDDPSLNYTQEEVEQLLAQHEQLIITDPYLCREPALKTAREMLDRLGFSVVQIDFENSPESCWHNIQQRGRSISRRFLDSLSQEYQSNANVEVKKYN